MRNQTHLFHNEIDVGIETVSDLAVLVIDLTLADILLLTLEDLLEPCQVAVHPCNNSIVEHRFQVLAAGLAPCVEPT